MRLKPLAILALACSLHAQSDASVIYEWKSVDSNLPRGIGLTMEFTDAAVASGSADVYLPGLYNEVPPVTDPAQAGLLSFHYTAPGINAISYTQGYVPRNLSLLLDVDFSADGYLTGYIRANDTNSNFEMVSSGSLMKITDARSDQWMGGAGCVGNLALCNGATGYIRRDAAAEVPEPAPLGLLGAGVLAFLGLGLRRSRHSKTASARV
jgi:hypothetical protein